MVHVCMMRRRHWHARAVEVVVDIVVDVAFTLGRKVYGVCLRVCLWASVRGRCERVSAAAGASARTWVWCVRGCGVCVCLQMWLWP